MKFIPVLTDFNQLEHCCTDDLYYFNQKPFSGVILTYHKNKMKQSQTTLSHGQIQGRYQAWYQNGFLKVIGQYQDHQERGLWTFYHDNNVIARTGHFYHGLRVGYWRIWTKQGKIIWSGEFHLHNTNKRTYHQKNFQSFN